MTPWATCRSALDEPCTMAPPDTLRRHIEAVEDEAGCLLVVAHNPGVHLLAYRVSDRERGLAVRHWTG
jgi:phosphohistidine phosphatase SixA